MKYILLTDIHFGNKNNLDEFNQQCVDFLKYVNDYADKNLKSDSKYGGVIFLGDWFHNRNSINVKTLNYGLEGISILDLIGNGNAQMILGNHDLYYRDRRDVNSVIIPENCKVNVISEPIYDEKNKLLFLPWLIGDENLKEYIKKYNPEYVFGHFEIPSFSFNKMIKMDGEYNPQDYNGPKRIMSGHFHIRQEKNNITYIGNCFSHDFSDSNEWHNKGFAVLDTETNKIEYHEWEDAIKFAVCKISELNKIEFGNNLSLKLINDLGLKMEQLNSIQEQLTNLPQIKNCFIYPGELDIKTKEIDNVKIENIENIDTLIIELLSSLEGQNKDSLINLYKTLTDE